MPVSPAQQIVRFGLFELDVVSGQLSRQGLKLRLAQQPLQLLIALLERPGAILTREELRRRLWASDVFVDFDHGLNKSIQTLRDTLGDSAASPRYIETLPRVGYRFIAPVSHGAIPAAVVVEPPVPAFTPAPAPPAQPPGDAPEEAGEASTGRKPRPWLFASVAAIVAAAVALALSLYLASRTHSAPVRYTKLTNFSDSASSPALSADGKMLAFYRSGDPFFSSDPIYVKILPNGEPRKLTGDNRLKYSLAFSPDGSEIAYTAIQDQTFVTEAVSTLGGEPHLLLHNAVALTWLDAEHVLFGRVRSGLHLGVVTSDVTGSHLREIYYPAHERAMAHYSYASPDRASALVVEMNAEGEWDRCHLISLHAAFAPQTVGPDGGCTAAGWSPDGASMYFVADVETHSHLWRQRFPDGQPQQITFGPTEEEGLAVENSGKSVITGMGVQENALWIHDEQGERPLSSEGEIVNNLTPPLFTADDQFLYYLTLHQPTDPGPELWRLTVPTGNSEPVLPGIQMKEYDVSADGKEVVYTTAGRNGKTQLWLAPLDRSAPPQPIGNGGERWPHFGPGKEIVFQAADGDVNYLERMDVDGRGLARVMPYPILDLQSVSPGRTWLAGTFSYPQGNASVPMIMAVPLGGGAPRRLCESLCIAAWASSGRFLYLAVEAATHTGPGRSLALPLGSGEALPPLPAEGIRPGADATVVRGSQSVGREEVIGGKDPAHFAYIKTAVHRNLYRVTLP